MGLTGRIRFWCAGTFLGAALAAAPVALAQQDPLVEEDDDPTEITATLTARAVAEFRMPVKVALEVGEDMVADRHLYDQAVRSLEAAKIALDDNSELTLAVDFDAEPLGDTGRQVVGLGDRDEVDQRRIYSGDRDPYTGESYLSEQEFGIAIGIGKGDRKALGTDYQLTARVYNLTGEITWSGSVTAVIVGATPEVVGEAMLEKLLEELGNNVAAKKVVLASGDPGTFGTQRPPRKAPSSGGTRDRDATTPPAIPVEPGAGRGDPDNAIF